MATKKLPPWMKGEKAEPKKEEKKEAKMPMFMRKKVEAKEGKTMLKRGGKVCKG